MDKLMTMGNIPISSLTNPIEQAFFINVRNLLISKHGEYDIDNTTIDYSGYDDHMEGVVKYDGEYVGIVSVDFGNEANEFTTKIYLKK